MRKKTKVCRKRRSTTGRKLQAQISVARVVRILDQVCPEAWSERTDRIYFWTLRFATAIRSFNSFPWMRSAPTKNSPSPFAESGQPFPARASGGRVIATEEVIYERKQKGLESLEPREK